MSEILSTEILVVGAGVVGLAIAAELSVKNQVILVEQFPQFGRETSSRNSEVVHSGIYYPNDSLKTELCIEGRKLLYAYCDKNVVPYKKCGKYVVATSTEEENYLENLLSHSEMLGVPVQRKTKTEIEKAEPKIQVASGLYFPESGILDSHVLMQKLENQILKNGATVAYRHRVKHIQFQNEWETILDSSDGKIKIQSRKVINCAGLFAAELSNQVLSTQKYEHRYCRGRYFSLAPKFQNAFQHLIYPVPPKDGLGVHVTLDQMGYARLGPDVDWCLNVPYSKVESLYDCDWETLKEPFLASAKRYCPTLEPKDISPALIGIRPKLFIDGKASPDFLIENHKGFIHCLGIESPGLTASLAIAKQLEKLGD